MELHRYSEISVRDLIKKRKTFPERNEVQRTLSEKNIKRAFMSITDKERTEAQIKETIAWVEKISEYVPIPTENELEEIIKLMISLSEIRARLNFLYDKPGLDLMNRVRECMIRYLVVLSELRVQRTEYIPHWFKLKSWIFDWSSILLDLSPSDNMEKYSFTDLIAHDFFHLLTLELACADSMSNLEKPMLRMQELKNKPGEFIILPTEAAAAEYQLQVSKILNNELTFTEWINDTLTAYNLPKA